MKLSIIAAYSHRRVIGYQQQLPWGRFSADLKRFKQLTLGHVVIMGRKTFESIDRPLVDRFCIVISQTLDPKSIRWNNYQICRSFNDALQLASQQKEADNSEVFVIGGAILYQTALHAVQQMYLTEIHADFTGDTYFPDWTQHEWKQTYLESAPQSASFHFKADFAIYQRKDQNKS